MNQEPPNHTDFPQASTEGAEKGLHQALSALEVLLNSAGAENIRQTGNKASGAGFGYHSSVEDEEGEHEEAERLVLPNTDSEEFQSLARQLTDEIEVIVQSRVEEALRDVTKNITRQVKTHLDIMLSAFLDDLANLGFRKDE